MNITTFLDVAIGLVIVYLAVSLLVTIANEYIAQTLDLRAGQLKKDLARLIDDPNLVKALSQNPALEPFFRRAETLFQRLATRLFGPSLSAASFVDPNVLAQQLMGAIAARAPADDKITAPANGNEPASNRATADANSLLAGLGTLQPDCTLKPQLQALVRVGSAETDKLVQNVGAYLDRTLSAMGEVYKRKMQLISLGVGLGVAVAFNVDTVLLVNHLYRDKEAREAMVTLATQLTTDTAKTQFDKCRKLADAELRKDAECKQFSSLIDALSGRNETLGKLPIGWESLDAAKAALGLAKTDTASTGPTPLARWTGLLLTALAVSLGASFWFDLLNRFVNIRHAMRKPEAKQASGGEAGK